MSARLSKEVMIERLAAVGVRFKDENKHYKTNERVPMYHTEDGHEFIESYNKCVTSTKSGQWSIGRGVAFSTRKDFAELCHEISSQGFSILSDGEFNTNSKIVVACNTCGWQTTGQARNLSKGSSRCQRCSGRKTREECERILQSFGKCFAEPPRNEEFCSTRQKYAVLCHRCGIIASHYLQRALEGCNACDCAGSVHSATNYKTITMTRATTVYLVEMTGFGEKFFKVGKRVKDNVRFSKSNMPYDVRTITEFEFAPGQGDLCSRFELRCHRELAIAIKKAVPMQLFDGNTECFVARRIASIVPEIKWLSNERKVIRIMTKIYEETIGGEA